MATIQVNHGYDQLGRQRDSCYRMLVNKRWQTGEHWLLGTSFHLNTLASGLDEKVTDQMVTVSMN